MKVRKAAFPVNAVTCMPSGQSSGLACRILAFAMALAPTFAPCADANGKVPATHTLLTDRQLTLEIVDLCPRFMDFYAVAENAPPASRWRLWNEKYGFAAVPPTPSGTQLAHKMLDAAWPRYAQILPVVQRGAAALKPDPRIALRQVANALDFDGPFEMQLVVYVGGFEGNTFTTVQGNKPVVAVPIEMDATERELALRHEMTHAVHIRTAGLSGSWERSIAETIFQEGLAMRVTQSLVPGRPNRDYVHEFETGWYAKSMTKARAIVEGIQPALERKDSETVEQFTMGQGTTGTTREAYVAGWVVMGELLREGQTLPQLARVPEPEMADIIRAAMSRLLELPDSEWKLRE